VLATWFDALLEAVPPPDQPCNPGYDEDWSAVETYFGLSFPADYKGLIRHYGSGAWGGCLWVLNPFSVNRYLNPRLIIENAHRWCREEPAPPSSDPVFLEAWDRYRQAARTRRRASPYRFFPEVPGLFPGAFRVRDGHREEHWLYWLAGDVPDRWPVVIERCCGEPHFSRQVDMGCCEFLLKWLRGEPMTDGLPSPTADEKVGSFVPQLPNPRVLTTYSWSAERQG
jgi:hypothetical protein